MSDIELMLQQKALEDAQFRGQVNDFALAGGGLGGSVLGIMSGRGAKGRMAGGLIGAILGGGLGRGTAEAVMEGSPAAAMLAKMQVQGGLNETDRINLEAMLKREYNNPAGL